MSFLKNGTLPGEFEQLGEQIWGRNDKEKRMDRKIIWTMLNLAAANVVLPITLTNSYYSKSQVHIKVSKESCVWKKPKSNYS